MPKNKSKLTVQWSQVIKTIITNGTKSYKPILTDRQYDVLNAWMNSSITQENISTELGICQTSVHKSLFGNIDYSYIKGRRFGGLLKKIKKYESGNYSVGPNQTLRLRKK